MSRKTIFVSTSAQITVFKVSNKDCKVLRTARAVLRVGFKKSSTEELKGFSMGFDLRFEKGDWRQ